MKGWIDRVFANGTVYGSGGMRFDQGGLKGRTTADSYYVRCDETNNPQSVIDAGMLICEVGVAVAAPMEFVVFEIRRNVGALEVAET